MRNAVGVIETIDPSLKLRVYAEGCTLNQCMPTRASCHKALDGIYSQYLRLVKGHDVLQRFANGILTPFTTVANKALPSAILHCSSGVTGGSEDCSDSCF